MSAGARDTEVAAGTTPPGSLTYEFRIREWGDRSGWWTVEHNTSGSATWYAVAQVFGHKRAEIVRDALSQEANERV